MTSNETEFPNADRNATASPRPPEQTGLKAATFNPCSTQYLTNHALNTVLPTPVSVPVTKKTRFMPPSNPKPPAKATKTATPKKPQIAH
jgi:hypothetical protein